LCQLSAKSLLSAPRDRPLDPPRRNHDERLRESGELFAVRSGDGGEWLYPAWSLIKNGKGPA
jgi:hypothetical protein